MRSRKQPAPIDHRMRIGRWVVCSPRCEGELCNGCRAYEGFAAGDNARVRDDDRSRREIQDATPYIDIIRRSPAHRPVVRLWDEYGFDAGWAKIKDMECIEWIQLEFRRCPLSYGRVLEGELAPVDGDASALGAFRVDPAIA